MASIHQVNHPGKEPPLNKNNPEDYCFCASGNKGVFSWNKSSNGHYRKFMEHKGRYVNSINASSESAGLLRFWGEYEGFSEFELLNNPNRVPYYDNPYAVHRPVFSTMYINDQNTDPYLFGEEFYYAICGKSGLETINIGDIILFGTEFGKNGDVDFYLDTLLVVDRVQPSIFSIYDHKYQESTLKRIGISNNTNGTSPIHVGRKFINDCKMFSFFPAKTADYEGFDKGFGRPKIKKETLGIKKPGARAGVKSTPISPEVSPEEIQEVWKSIVEQVLDQKFVLGTHLDDLQTKDTFCCTPPIINCANGISKGNCGHSSCI